MRVLRRVRRFLTLSRAERRLFVRAFVRLGVIDAALRTTGFRSLVSGVERRSDEAGEHVTADELRRAAIYATWLDTASRCHFVRARCLHRSLALHQWLQQEGLPSELRIGVRKDGPLLRAHAWVELAGQVVNDYPAAVTSFTPLSMRYASVPGWSDRVGRLLNPSRLGEPAGVRWQ